MPKTKPSLENAQLLNQVPIESVKPYPDNYVKHKRNRGFIANSIRDFGYISPIAVDENMVILKGHGTLEALKSLNFTHVPYVLKKIGLTEDQKKGYRIADNETARGAERSRDLLDREMATLPKYDFRKYGVLTNVNSTAREVMDGVLELEAGGEPEMKIMQQFNERYDYVIIIAKNETDRANLFTSMEIKNERSNKQQAVGLGRVVSFERFQSLLKKWKGEK